jgi:hypothetical protein
LNIHLLVGKIGEVDITVANGVIASAIFVDAGSGVKARRCYIYDASPGLAFDDDAPSAFAGPHLDPVEVIAIY